MEKFDGLTPDERQQIAALTKIFLDAFDAAAEQTGVPVNIVAQQFADELCKLAADRARLDAACAEIDTRQPEFENDRDADESSLE